MAILPTATKRFIMPLAHTGLGIFTGMTIRLVMPISLETNASGARDTAIFTKTRKDTGIISEMNGYRFIALIAATGTCIPRGVLEGRILIRIFEVVLAPITFLRAGPFTAGDISP